MATPAGFEPATPRLEGACSIQLSYGAPAPTSAKTTPKARQHAVANIYHRTGLDARDGLRIGSTTSGKIKQQKKPANFIKAEHQRGGSPSWGTNWPI